MQSLDTEMFQKCWHLFETFLKLHQLNTFVFCGFLSVGTSVRRHCRTGQYYTNRRLACKTGWQVTTLLISAKVDWLSTLGAPTFHREGLNRETGRGLLGNTKLDFLNPTRFFLLRLGTIYHFKNLLSKLFWDAPSKEFSQSLSNFG